MDWISKINKRNEETGLQLTSRKTGKRCLFCGLHKENGKVDYTCSDCVQLMLMTSQEELKQAYDKAIRIGSHNQAWAIESFLKKEEANDRKTKHIIRSLERKRPLRMVRPSREQIRAQQTAFPLDQRWASICRES